MHAQSAILFEVSSPRPLEDCNMIGNCNGLQFLTVIATHLSELQFSCNLGWGDYKLGASIIKLVQEL